MTSGPAPELPPLSADGQAIAKGYTFDEPSIQLGVLVEGDTLVAGTELPDFGVGLVTNAKYVERQTIEAGLGGSRAAAVRALAHHPLVDSVTVARSLLEDAMHAFPALSYLR